MGWSGKAVENADDVEVSDSEIQGTRYVVTDLEKQDYEEYYNGFANSVLWPVLHYRQDLAEFSRTDLSGYMRVNQRFAQLLAALVKPDDVIWVHDYHLIPLARVLREMGLTNRIGFFLHIPMPPPEVTVAMPAHARVLGALADYDLVGFQTQTDTANFARYLARLSGTTPHFGRGALGAVRVGTFPVGIATREFQDTAAVECRAPLCQELLRTSQTFGVGVDRLDYSKGLDLKMEAYRRFLVANPQWCEKVSFLQITPKSRSAIPEYAAMETELATTTGRINSEFGNVLWTPVRYVTRAYPRDVLAGLFRISKVGVVTPLRDGMNLVAKEYVAAQDPADPGVLVLSEFAGASADLDAALIVNPNDPDAVANAMTRALGMPANERQDRHRRLWSQLLRTDISQWGERFMAKLLQTTSRSGPFPLAAE
jgi:trehalose 6-phosphate synthase